MSDYATVATAIDTLLKSATGVIAATVYKYERYTTQDSSYISSFKDTTGNVIHGYIITRTKIEETPEASRTNKESCTWLIRMFYALGSSGATENTTFQPLIDTIRTKFRASPSVGGTVLTSEPLQVDRIENLMFGSVLVHYAEMRLVTEDEVAYT